MAVTTGLQLHQGRSVWLGKWTRPELNGGLDKTKEEL